MASLTYKLHKERDFRLELDLGIDEGKEKFFQYKPHCKEIILVDNVGDPLMAFVERPQHSNFLRRNVKK